MANSITELDPVQKSLVEAQIEKHAAEAKKLNIEAKQLSDPWQRLLNFMNLASASIVAVVGMIAGVYGFWTGSERAKLATDQLSHVKVVTAFEMQKLKTTQDQLKKARSEVNEKSLELKELEAESLAELESSRKEIEGKKREARAFLEKIENEIRRAETRLAQIQSSLPPSAATLAAKDQVLDVVSQLNAAVLTASKEDQSTGESRDSELMDRAIQDLYSTKSSERLRGYATITKKFRSNSDLVPKLLAMARTNADNENGIYNTAVTLSHISPSITRPATDQIKQFCTSAKLIGEKTKARCKKLIDRISK